MGGSRERRVMELVSPDEFQQVVDAFGVPVIELDEHLVVRSINGAAIKRDRRDLSEIVGRPFFESWPGLNSSLLSNAIADVLERKQARIVEIDFSEVPSNEKWTEFRVHPLGAGVILIAQGALGRKSETRTAQSPSEPKRTQLRSEIHPI